MILKDLQGGLGGPVNNGNHGIVHDLHSLFAVSMANLYVAGTAVAAYAVLEGTEAGRQSSAPRRCRSPNKERRPHSQQTAPGKQN